jgi:hypothetical protein
MDVWWNSWMTIQHIAFLVYEPAWSLLEVPAFSFTGEIKPKIEIKMEKILKWSDFGDFQLSEVRKKNGKICYIFIFLFQCVARKNKWVKICISYLVYSHIWLNLPRDDLSLFLHVINDPHFGCKQKFLWKNISFCGWKAD